MVLRNVPRLLLEIYNQWKRNTLSCPYLFREILQYLGYWRTSREGDKIPSLLNIIIARSTFWFCLVATIIIFPFNAYLAFGVDLLGCIQATATIFVTALLAIISGSLNYRSNNFDDAMTALDEMADAASRHLVSPEVILTLITNFDTILYYLPFVCLVMPAAIVVVPTYSLITGDFVIKSWYPYDWKKSPAFELTVTVWTVVAMLSFHMLVAAYSHLISLLAEAVKNLKLLNYNLSRIVQLTKTERDEVHSPERSQTVDTSVESSDMEDLHALGNQALENNASERKNSCLPVEISTARKIVDDDRKVVIRNGEKEEERHGCRDFEDFSRRLEERFRICVIHHQSIISLVKITHKAYDLILMQHLICCICPIILGSLYLTTATEFESRMILFTLLMTVCLIDLAIFCWLAERICEESSLARDAIFGCDWINQSESFKKKIQIMMCRCNLPIAIKVAAFVPLKMETFHNLVKMVVSYYMSVSAVVNQASR